MNRFPEVERADAAISVRFAFRFAGPETHRFSLDVRTAMPGRGVTAIYGRSGSGKTTLLRCLAGLQVFNRKQVLPGFVADLRVNGQSWHNDRMFIPPHQRPIGYVFQEDGLFSHLTAEQNIHYGIRRAAVKPSSQLYEHTLALLGIQHLLRQRPEHLSGGERQRVAIARALLLQPKLLLMDEPLASLDSNRKEEILPYLESLKRELDIPIIYVTHAMEEIARLADHLLILDDGRVAAEGTLEQVLSRLDLPQLAADAGVVVEAVVVEKNADWHLLRARFSGGEVWLKDSGESVGQAIRLRILARDVSLARQCHDDTSILNRLPVEVLEIAPDVDASMCLVRLQAGQECLLARITGWSAEHLQLQPGQRLWAQIKSVAIAR